MNIKFFKSQRARGQTLIIILVMIVLLSAIVLGILVSSLYHSKIAANSVSLSKADLAAQGAISQIVSDLQQEIIDGSVVSTSGKMYIPNINASGYSPSVVPYVNFTAAAGLENLVKVSKYSIPFYQGSAYNNTGVSRASAGANPGGTAAPSLNGHYISAAQWQKPMLTAAAATIPTPDWILVAADGTNPIAAFSAAASGINGTNPVTQRYAYTLYDEGGTLDLNVAGYLAGTSTKFPYKNALAYADLTQLTTPLSTTQMNALITSLVNWRNISTITYFDNYISSNLSGFLKVGNSTQLTSAPAVVNTDNAFSSRQQMIQFLQAMNPAIITADTLQYFGTFSRGISQPSYIPPLNNPAMPPGAKAVIPITLATGVINPLILKTNSANGNDVNINPSFLDVRVNGAFLRNDGSAAVIGDPFVAKRFALNRLAWLTYLGPISDGQAGIATTAAQVTANATLQKMATALHDTYGLSYAFLQQGTAANIYNYFGLSWVTDDRQCFAGYAVGDGQMKWLYYHPDTAAAHAAAFTKYTAAYGGKTPTAILLVKDLVVGANGAPVREPDFFELLKASISCGSKAVAGQPLGILAPAGTFPALTDVSYYSQVDSSLDDAIIQIGANIIDQFDLDGFPTHILYNDGTNVGGLFTNNVLFTANEFNGQENMPYIYRVRMSRVQCIAPTIDPMGTDATSNAGDLIALSKGTITNFGASVLIEEPEIWDIYDQNSPRCAPALNALAVATPYPTSFRFVADTSDPYEVYGGAGAAPLLLIPATYGSLNIVLPNATQSTIQSQSSHILQQGSYQSNTLPPATMALNAAGSPFTKQADFKYPPFQLFAENSALSFTFDANGNANFRDPTLLAVQGVPAGSNLKMDGTANILVAGNPVANCTPFSGPSVRNLLNLNGNGISNIMGTALITAQNVNPTVGGKNSSNNIIGIYLNTFPDTFYLKDTPGGAAVIVNPGYIQISKSDSYSGGTTYRLQYQDPAGNWRTGDEKYMKLAKANNTSSPNGPTPLLPPGSSPPITQLSALIFSDLNYSLPYDPRTGRFDPAHSTSSLGTPNAAKLTAGTSYTPPCNLPYAPHTTIQMGDPNNYNWLNTTLATIPCQFPDSLDGYKYNTGTTLNAFFGGSNSYFQGLTTNFAPGEGKYAANAAYYKDPDGVVRHADGAWSIASGATSLLGFPAAPVSQNSGLVPNIPATQSQSRPIVLNRPFTSVAELGYVFSGTPWKNLDFTNYNSGDAPLLDVFCINDTDNPDNLINGTLNLNTRQTAVLTAVLAGAYKDEQNLYLPAIANSVGTLSPTEASKLAAALVSRTSTNPLTNVSDLVGRFLPIAPLQFDGFTKDIDTVYTLNGDAVGTSTYNIPRMRTAPVRALSAVGNTRVWNLMIDVVAQSGRYPATAANADNFIVEGEQHYWVHVAIDRLTGKVLDRSLELVKQ